MTNDAILDHVIATGEPYELIDCDPDLADTAQFCEAYGYRMDESANAIIVIGKADPKLYAACLVLATTRLDVNGAVRRRLGTRKASFAPAEDTMELTGMTIGGVTPFGLPPALPLWIDARIMELERVIVGGGSRDRKLYVAPTALTKLVGAAVVENLARVPSHQ